MTLTSILKKRNATPALGMVSLILLFATAASAASIPAGTRVTVRMGHQMSSETSRPGEVFEGSLARDLVVNGTTIAKAGATVLGISADTVEKQKKFKEKYDLPYTLLADPDKKTVNAYGVLKEKNMYGNKVMGIERTTFVINKKGKIAKIFPKVSPQGHAEEVLASLKQ